MTIESRFSVPFVASLALREKQIQQNYRPIIAVHKWFARRPGTLFRALALAEFGDDPLEDMFYRANSFDGHHVADPFMGGGTPLIEANRVGCSVTGFDVNPMAAWIVREELETLDLHAYAAASNALLESLHAELGTYYVTDCPLYGDTGVPVKYFLWVKCIACISCAKHIDLFRGYLLAENARHPSNVLVCWCCGALNEVGDCKQPGACTECSAALKTEGPANRSRCICPHCHVENRYPRPETGPPQHRLFAIEYYNPKRKDGHRGRFFKKPDAADLARVAAVKAAWEGGRSTFVPGEAILPGDETDRLHRWGYRYYREMFNERQLLGLETSARFIRDTADDRIRHALATNLSDLLRYQNMLCRYDTWALKSLDIFSVHGFPVGLIQCESNLLGIVNGKGGSVGSGGWSNIVDKYRKAKAYCDAPFEVRRSGARKTKVPIRGEWIGDGRGSSRRTIAIRCVDATDCELPEGSLDAVFTDPPYFGNVQYGELMDFCYVWLRRLVGTEAEGFDRVSTRALGELTGNVTQSRGLDHFTEGLAKVFTHMAQALKANAPLAFTYHHNKLDAYYAVGVAILDAGLVCSASLPCPAEMGGSIHIHGTGSSIVDTIFVCRKTGTVPRSWLANTESQLVDLVAEDLAHLVAGGCKPTRGDTRCITFGHLTRMTIWRLREDWDRSQSTAWKLSRFAAGLLELGNPDHIIERVLARDAEPALVGPLFTAMEANERWYDAVTF